MSGQQQAPAAIYTRKRHGTHFTGGWVGPRAGLDGGKSRLHRDSIPDRPARSSVAIPTELPGPRTHGIKGKGKGKVIPLEARCGPECWQKYSSTVP